MLMLFIAPFCQMQDFALVLHSFVIINFQINERRNMFEEWELGSRCIIFLMVLILLYRYCFVILTDFYELNTNISERDVTYS